MTSYSWTGMEFQNPDQRNENRSLSDKNIAYSTICLRLVMNLLKKALNHLQSKYFET